MAWPPCGDLAIEPNQGGEMILFAATANFDINSSALHRRKSPSVPAREREDTYLGACTAQDFHDRWHWQGCAATLERVDDVGNSKFTGHGRFEIGVQRFLQDGAPFQGVLARGGPLRGARTPNLRVRSPTLYPIELGAVLSFTSHLHFEGAPP